MLRIAVVAKATVKNGGTLPYTKSLIKGLKTLPNSRYKLTIFTQRKNYEYDETGKSIQRISWLKIIGGRLLFGKDFFSNYDLIVFPVYSLMVFWTRKPFIFTLHDMQERHFPENFAFYVRLWRNIINFILSRLATKIICESNFVKKDIQSMLGVPLEKIAVIPAPPVLGIQDQAVAQSQLIIRSKELGLPAQYIFYPAQFWPHKNHLRLIDAFRKVLIRHPNYFLVFTGQKRHDYKKIFSVLNESEIRKHILHLGHLSDRDLAHVYKMSTLVVVPTLYESISIPVYEAFKFGVPVCASNVVALPEQVGDAGILFDPYSPDDIAEKLCMVLENPTLKNYLVNQGRRRIHDINHENYSLKLHDLIRAIEA